MTLTKPEKELIKAYKENEDVQERGFDNIHSSANMNTVRNELDMTEKEFIKIIITLTKKGMVSVDEGYISLTGKGMFEACKL